MRFRGGALLAAGVAVTVPLFGPGTAVAGTGRPVASPDTAAYSVTGGRFIDAETWVRLPDAARFAGELGEIGITLQFRSKAFVMDLTAAACTDLSCRPGGRPVRLRYRLKFAVYRARTGKLVCSTSARGAEACPGVPSSWRAARLAPGSVVNFDIGCPIPYTAVFTSASNVTTGQDFGFSYYRGRRMTFSQARAGMEFGPTPWAHPAFRAPRKPVALARFDRPPPPPDADEITTISGGGAGFASWWTDHRVTMTSPKGSRIEAAPGRLRDDGFGFTVYLEP